MIQTHHFMTINWPVVVLGWNEWWFYCFFFFFSLLQSVRLKEPRGTKFIFFLICFSVSCSLFIHWDLFHCLFSGTENRVVFRGTDFLFLSLVSSLLFLFLPFSPWTNPLSWISTTGLSESVYLLHFVKRERRKTWEFIKTTVQKFFKCFYKKSQ